jgi:hypothetical protein
LFPVVLILKTTESEFLSEDSNWSSKTLGYCAALLAASASAAAKDASSCLFLSR